MRSMPPTGRWTLTGRAAMTVGRDVTVAPD
jgi:hypothetical protein